MNAVLQSDHPVLLTALEAADAGLAVVWQQGKRAIATGWNKGPALTADELQNTFRPGLNCAFRAGPTSRLRGWPVAVVDVDIRSADDADREEARAAYKALVGDLKPTVQTGGGGVHLYLRFPPDRLPTAPASVLQQSGKRLPSEDANKPGKPAWTIELLSGEHAVTMPPSVHPSGKAYQWKASLDDVQDAPESLLALLVASPECSAAEGDDDLPVLPAPTITSAMLYGITGDVMTAATEGRETNPAAVGAAFLSFAAVAFGREVTVPIGDARHAPRLYTCHVGRSSVAGKGMALELVKRIRRRMEEIQDAATGHMHDGGLSSREGLAWMIRDPSDTVDKEGEPTDPGIIDKRLWVIEEEFANVLHQTQRDGNTLSSALRTAWDGHDLAPATKTNRTRASRPHIGLHASITPFELSELLDDNALSNGFANRFLFVWGERRGIVPFPPRTPAHVVDDLARRLLDCIALTKSQATMTASDDARGLYAEYYRQHRRGAGLSSEVRGLIQRHPPYAWRLAMLFALLDMRLAIEQRHMRAALAWLDYFRASTVMVFSSARREAEAAGTSALADRILRILAEVGGQLDREPLRLALGKPDKTEYDAALSHLSETGQATESATPRPGGGRPRRTITLVSAKDPAGGLDGLGGLALHKAFSKPPSLRGLGGLPPEPDNVTDQTAQTAEAARFAETQAGRQTALTAQTAEGVLSDAIEEIDL